MMIDPPSADQSTFDICYAEVSFAINLVTPAAGNWAEP